MKIIELFAGIGACSKALEKLGIDLEILDAVEIDKYAIKSFNVIHGTNFEPQDITKWDKYYEDVDLITHGSPCQDFSVAGLQAGGDLGSGTRSSLMYESIRIIDNLRPKYVLWENVKNLLSKKHKHNFDAYIETMNNLGYTSYYQVLNAKDYGIPQNRERVFTISIRNDIKKDFKFPKKEDLKLRLKDLLEDEVDEKYYLNKTFNLKFSETKVSWDNSGKGYNSQQNRAYYQDGLCPALSCCNTNGDKSQVVLQDKNKYMEINNPKAVEPLELIQVGELDMKGHEQMKRFYSPEGLSPTLTTMGGGNTEPKIITEGNYMPSGHDASRIVNENGLAPTVKENHGTVTAVLQEPKIITHNIIQTVKVRKYPVDTDKLKTVLREAKVDNDISNKQLERALRVPLTTVEHWFRKDNCFSIPTPDVWFRLKEILKIDTDEFDESIITFEEKENIYEKSNRVYDEVGLAPTLTQQEEKITNNIRIRKLTPKECWRLMGFDDEDFEKAQKVNSNTQLYKQSRK